MMTDQCLQSFLSRRQLPQSGCKVENFAAPHQYFTLRVEHKHFINNYFYTVTRLITSVCRCFKYKWSCFLYMVLVVEEFALYKMEYFRYRFVFSNSLIQTVNSKNAKNIRFNQQILKLTLLAKISVGGNAAKLVSAFTDKTPRCWRTGSVVCWCVVSRKNKVCNFYVLLQKPVSCWEMHRSSSGRLFTATMVSASCLDTTELKSCTGAARASKMLFVV